MTFGFSTTIDILSWIAATLLAIKLVATITLLCRNRSTRYETCYGSALWWATKSTPMIAVPCVIVTALIQNNRHDAYIYAGMMLFVLVTVPIMIWKRFYRPVAEHEITSN
jgi:hypothetical protein